MRNVFLAFDLGASSGRGMLGVFENGKLELKEVHRFANGPMEKDGALYWDYPGLCSELLAGVAKALALEPAIDGIGVDTWGVDYLLFDRATGAPKRLPYHYRDSRTDAMPEAVFSIIPKPELYARTGMQFMQLNTIYQLMAHHRQHPEDFVDAELLPIPDALTRFLGGAHTAEYTECSTTNLLDPAGREWDFGLIEKLGLPRDVFPPIVEPCTPCGQLAPEHCRALKCAPIPLYKVGSHDTASAVAAVPAPSEGNWAYISCGTWALLGAEIDEPILTPAAEAVPFTNEGGLDRKIRFLTNIMGSWLIQETQRHWQENGKKLTFAEMEELALAAEPGRFLIDPCAADFLAPGDMPRRIRDFCVKTGQGDIPDDGALMRTIYDSLALCFARGVDKLESLLDTRYAALNLVGGGTRAEFLMQLTADAINRPAIAGPVEGTAIGNLLAQGIAAGLIDDLRAARGVVKRSFEPVTYLPRPESAARMAALRKRFDALVG